MRAVDSLCGDGGVSRGEVLKGNFGYGHRERGCI